MYSCVVSKTRVYALVLQAITYESLIVSCYGRCHPDSVEVLDYIARKIARQRGLNDHVGLLYSTRRNISAAIWRRAAKMIHACLPQHSKESIDLLFGVDPSNVSVEEVPINRIVVRGGDATWTA